MIERLKNSRCKLRSILKVSRVHAKHETSANSLKTTNSTTCKYGINELTVWNYYYAKHNVTII